MEHLALERVGLVLASAYEVCSASAVAVVKALKAPILVEDAPAHGHVGSDKLGVGVRGIKNHGKGWSVPDITPAQIGAGATLHVHISGVELVEVLGAVDGLAVKKHLLHARIPRLRLRLARLPHLALQLQSLLLRRHLQASRCPRTTAGLCC